MITVVVGEAELAGETLELTGDVHHHLSRVRRVTPGEAVRAVDGNGRARSGEVVAVERRTVRVRLGAAAATHEPAARVELLVAALRAERAEWLVEKATELGVAAVRFFRCARTPRDYGEGRLERMRRVAVAAVEQCHRSVVPAVSGVHGWDELPALIGDLGCRYVLDASGAAPPAAAASATALLVGPEGGWTPAELATTAELGCLPVSLGARALRVETAAVAALARVVVG